MTPGPGTRSSLGRMVRARPGRAVAVVALAALVLVVAAVTLGRSGRAAPVAGPGGTPGRPATGGPRSTGADGGAGSIAPSGGGATGSTDGAGTPSGGGAATSRGPGAQPAPGGGGVAGGAGGGGGGGGPEPVALRPPVRCASKGAPAAAPLPPVDERDGKRWVTVGRLAGNCDASSPTFRLLGIDTRLVWRSDADSFTVFVVDAAQGREATAGFADGQCAGSCSERQPLVPAAGEYRLEVQAGDAPWEVEIQEYRQPGG